MSTAMISSLVLLAAGIAPALAADPTGDWQVADGVADIRVAECNGSMWGAVAWEKKPGGKDTNNPDAAKRNRPTLGMPILLDMKKKPGTDSWDGEVYNAKDGRTYSASITPIDPDHLEIKGCVLGFLCGGETWTRVGPPIASSPVNSMARSSGKSTKVAGAPRTTGSANAAARRAAKHGTDAADPIGDICLLPDIAGLAH